MGGPSQSSDAARPQADGELRSPHATVFLDPVAADVEPVRRQWDPLMASLIAAHVTVAYPNEVSDLTEMSARAQAAVRRQARFTLELGAVQADGDPPRGVFLDVHDLDGGLMRVRRAIAGRDCAAIPPHVTLVHPRTSDLAAAAWCDLEGVDLSARFVVRSIAVTAFDGSRWVTTSEHALG